MRGWIIAGDKTLETARKLRLKQIGATGPEGENLVAVRRQDLDLKTELRASLATVRNRVTEMVEMVRIPRIMKGRPCRSRVGLAVPTFTLRRDAL
jgi:hypothetical protein